MNINSTDQPTEQEYEELTLPMGEVLLANVRKVIGNEVEVEFVLKGKIFKQLAQSTVPLGQSDIVGRQVVVSFINGDITKPIVTGLVHSTLNALLENFEITSLAGLTDDAATSSTVDKPTQQSTQQTKNEASNTDATVNIDGKPLVLAAKEELQLRCGDASITLTKDGKILIRGKYLLNRASGINRIVGGSVQVN